MKSQIILTIAALSLSSLSMAGDFHGRFDSQTPTVINAQVQSSAQQLLQQSSKPFSQQNVFEQNNNWHVQHVSR